MVETLGLGSRWWEFESLQAHQQFLERSKMQVRASHILVATQEQAVQLHSLITEGGADFAQLAQMHSRCPSSRQGGDLGQFGPGQMVQPFEQVTYATNVGSVSEPVQTQFGWHLIKRTA